MPMFVVNVNDSDSEYVNNNIATITAIIPRLATRYVRRKNDFLNSDDKILLKEVSVAVDNLLRQLMRFGVFVPETKTNGAWGVALESAINLNETWQKIRTNSVVDISVLEEMMVFVRTIRNVLSARISSGKWL